MDELDITNSTEIYNAEPNGNNELHQSSENNRKIQTVDTITEMSSTEAERSIEPNNFGEPSFVNNITRETVLNSAYSHSTLENRINELLTTKTSNTKPSITHHSRHFKTAQTSKENIHANQSFKTGHRINTIKSVHDSNMIYGDAESFLDVRKQSNLGSNMKATVNIAYVMESFKRKVPNVFPLLHEAYKNQLLENASER